MSINYCKKLGPEILVKILSSVKEPDTTSRVCHLWNECTQESTANYLKNVKSHIDSIKIERFERCTDIKTLKTILVEQTKEFTKARNYFLSTFQQAIEYKPKFDTIIKNDKMIEDLNLLLFFHDTKKYGIEICINTHQHLPISQQADKLRYHLSNKTPLAYLKHYFQAYVLAVRIPKMIDKFKNLKTLTITNTQISTLPFQLFSLEKLESLNLSFNLIKEIPSQINKLKKLHTLNLKRNQLLEIPGQIGELTSLKRFELSKNNLNNLPEQLKNCQKLYLLNLSYNKFSHIPEVCYKLINLKSFDLTHNRIHLLSPNIKLIKKLEYLYLFNNHLETLPEELIFLKKLKLFQIDSSSKLNKIPRSLYNNEVIKKGLDFRKKEINQMRLSHSILVIFAVIKIVNLFSLLFFNENSA